MRRGKTRAQSAAHHPVQSSSRTQHATHDHGSDHTHSDTEHLYPIHPSRAHSLAPSWPTARPPSVSRPGAATASSAPSPYIYITPTPPLSTATAMHTHTSSSGSPITPSSGSHFPFDASTGSLPLPIPARGATGTTPEDIGGTGGSDGWTGDGGGGVGMRASTSEGGLGLGHFAPGSGQTQAHGNMNQSGGMFDMLADVQGEYISPPHESAGAGAGYFTLNPAYMGGEALSLSGASSPRANHLSLHQQQQQQLHQQQQQPTHRTTRQTARGGSSASASTSLESTSPAHRYTSLPYPLASPPLAFEVGPASNIGHGTAVPPAGHTTAARSSRADSTGQTSDRPQRPTLHRTRTSQSSNGTGKDAEKEKAEASAKSAAKRASKACENCRLRRRKCSEQRPCKACVDIGLGGSCTFRAKARPNRALPKVIDSHITLDSLILDPPLMMPQTCIVSPSSVGLSHAHPVRDIDATVELWLAEQGQPMSLSLYDPPSLLSDLGTKPLPPLLSPAAETHAVHSFLESTARYFAFLHGPRMLEMLRLHHATPTHHGFFVSQHQPDVTSPGGLRPDERAMVYAAICLGRFKEIPPIQAGPGVQVAAARHGSSSAGASAAAEPAQGQKQGQGHGSANTLGMVPSGAGQRPLFGAGVGQEHKTVPLSVRLREMREDSGYFCRAVLELQKWGGASLTTLGALQCLHLFTLLSGGAAEMRDVLGRMAWQVRELGLHQVDSAGLFAQEDRVDRLFYTTLHEENWFATLLDAPPFILSNTYDPSLTPSWDKENTDGEGWIDQHPCVVQLTMFENELLTMIHTLPELSQAFLFDMEARLADWMKAFREEQLAVPSWMLHTYANIRFHWIRIMLRAPLLSNPHFRLASLATVCRSSSQILLSYHSFADTASFLPTWGECRRILTCAHLVVLGHWEGEFLMAESEFLGGVAVHLLEKLDKGCPFLVGARERLGLMFGLLGIAPRKPFGMGPPPATDPPEPTSARSAHQRMPHATPQEGITYASNAPFQQVQPQSQVTAAEYAIGNYTFDYANQQQQPQQQPPSQGGMGQVPLPQNPRLLPALNPMPQDMTTVAHHAHSSTYGAETLHPINAFGAGAAASTSLSTGTGDGSGLDQTIFGSIHGQQPFTPFDTAQMHLAHSHAGSPTGASHFPSMGVGVPDTTLVAPGEQGGVGGLQGQHIGVGPAVEVGGDAGSGASRVGETGEVGDLTGVGAPSRDGMDQDDSEQPGWLDPWLDAMLWTGSDAHSAAGSMVMQVAEADQ